MSELKRLWNETCLNADITAITTDTAARLMAVLMYHGNNEELTHNKKFTADCEYIQRKYHIFGGELVDGEFSSKFIDYAKELEEYEKSNGDNEKTQWAKDLYKKMYDIVI